jgi:predicted nucleic acid-binding protein
MIYVDTSVFVNAVTEDRRYGKSCMRILEDIEARKFEAVCSRLVPVEYVNSLSRINRELKRHAMDPFPVDELTDALLSMVPNWFELNDQIVRRAAGRDEEVNPADYFHVATMEACGAEVVISADSDFDRFAGVERLDPLGYRTPRSS